VAKNDDEVVVFETTDPIELGLARNVLAGEGIPLRVEGGTSSSFLGALLGPQALGLHSIAVPAELEERALAALRAAWPEGAVEDGAPD